MHSPNPSRRPSSCCLAHCTRVLSIALHARRSCTLGSSASAIGCAFHYAVVARGAASSWPTSSRCPPLTSPTSLRHSPLYSAVFASHDIECVAAAAAPKFSLSETLHLHPQLPLSASAMTRLMFILLLLRSLLPLPPAAELHLYHASRPSPSTPVPRSTLAPPPPTLSTPALLLPSAPSLPPTHTATRLCLFSICSCTRTFAPPSSAHRAPTATYAIPAPPCHLPRAHRGMRESPP
jgi:hypothetical protein